MRHAALAIAALLAAAGAARGQPLSAPLQGEALFNAPRKGPELWVGAGPIVYPRYPGAARGRLRLIPAITGGWGERLDFDLLDGARLSAIDSGGWSAGPAARVRFGRHASDDRQRLAGLREFADTVELGGFVAYEAGPLAVDSTLTQDPFGAHRGAVSETRAVLSAAHGRMAIGGGPFVRAVSQRFAASYYGIDAGLAGRPAYDARGGFERLGWTMVAEWRPTDGFAVRAFVEAGRLVASPARSPLVRGDGGARDQVAAGVFLVWRAF